MYDEVSCVESRLEPIATSASMISRLKHDIPCLATLFVYGGRGVCRLYLLRLKLIAVIDDGTMFGKPFPTIRNVMTSARCVGGFQLS